MKLEDPRSYEMNLNERHGISIGIWFKVLYNQTSETSCILQAAS